MIFIPDGIKINTRALRVYKKKELFVAHFLTNCSTNVSFLLRLRNAFGNYAAYLVAVDAENGGKLAV